MRKDGRSIPSPAPSRPTVTPEGEAARAAREARSAAALRENLRRRKAQARARAAARRQADPAG
jgi:hypothetical protein